MKLLRLLLLALTWLLSIYLISGSWEGQMRGSVHGSIRLALGAVALVLALGWLLEEARRKEP